MIKHAHANATPALVIGWLADLSETHLVAAILPPGTVGDGGEFLKIAQADNVTAGRPPVTHWHACDLTIPPLPMVKPDADDVKAQMVARLNEALCNNTESLSSRMDAVLDLCVMADEEEPSQEDWGMLCGAPLMGAGHQDGVERRTDIATGTIIGGG